MYNGIASRWSILLTVCRCCARHNSHLRGMHGPPSLPLQSPLVEVRELNPPCHGLHDSRDEPGYCMWLNMVSSLAIRITSML